MTMMMTCGRQHTKTSLASILTPAERRPGTLLLSSSVVTNLLNNRSKTMFLWRVVRSLGAFSAFLVDVASALESASLLSPTTAAAAADDDNDDGDDDAIIVVARWMRRSVELVMRRLETVTAREFTVVVVDAPPSGRIGDVDMAPMTWFARADGSWHERSSDVVILWCVATANAGEELVFAACLPASGEALYGDAWTMEQMPVRRRRTRFGQIGLVTRCNFCGARDPPWMCGTCGVARYCTKDCQSAAWTFHEPTCQPVVICEFACAPHALIQQTTT